MTTPATAARPPGDAPHELIRLEEASAAIARVASIAVAKDLADKSAAIKLLSAKQGWAREQQVRVAEIYVRATARLGELLAVTEKRRGGRGRSGGGCRGRTKQPQHGAPPALADLGINKHESGRAQRVARVPTQVRERYIRAAVQAGDAPTLAGLLKLAKQRQREEKRSALASLRGASTVQDLGDLVAAGARFSTIYADPPWKYGNQATRGSTDDHYPTLAVEEIAALPLRDLAAADAHLYLWTTSAFLFRAPEVIAAWGFAHKAEILWIKPQMGMGNYVRVSHEFLLVCARGAATHTEAKDQMSWVRADRQRHSAKPDVFREIVERLSPGPYLELFARKEWEGWTVWGNEVAPLGASKGE